MGDDRIGFIYAIEAGEAIKIGFSGDPVRRCGALNTASATRHTLLGTMPGTRTGERAVHDKCYASRLNGEWFSKSPEVMEFVGTLTPYEEKKVASPAQIWRKSKGLTREKLATLTGYSQTAIVDFEHGERRGKVGKYAVIDANAWLRYRLACAALDADVSLAF